MQEILSWGKILSMRNFFLHFKDYKVDTEYGLKWPTDNFYNYMEKLSKAFFKNFESYIKQAQYQEKHLQYFK